jgi:hypothetical protein
VKLCRIGELIAEAEEPTASRLRSDVEAGKFSATRLAFILTAFGFAVGETTIRKHRRKECLCHLKMPSTR